MNPHRYRAPTRALSTAVASLAGTIAVSTLLLLLVLPHAAIAATPTATSVTAATVEPLPESNYTVRPACAAPTPGHASCLALSLQPASAAARARNHPIGMRRRTPVAAPTASEGVDGLTPEDLRNAYFPGEEARAAAPQTIALVDAYNDYAAEADLQVYDKEFNLPALTKCETPQEDDCFEQVDQEGSSDAATLPFPHSEAALIQTVEVCRVDLAKAQKHETPFSEAGEQACYEAEEAGGWAVEISTDIEIAHSTCRNCKVLLVEGGKATNASLREAEETTSYPNLGEGDQSAVTKLGATEVSNSWGGPEPDEEEERELEADGVDAFDYPGTVITASAGDAGYLNWTKAEEAEAEKQECLEHARTLKERDECDAIGYSVGANYPASSPHVVAVGGTELRLNSAGARESESVWNEDPDPQNGNDGAGGGGCSKRFAAPPWQQAAPDWTEVGCASDRAVADIAADADPYTGVAVYDSVPELQAEENKYGETEIVETAPTWEPIGGTSVASPIIASMFALAGGAHGVEYPAATLYSHLETTSLHDVTSGGNGRCNGDYLSCSGSLNQISSLYAFDCGEGKLICNAAPGCENRYYDGPTGVGTPDGIGALRPEPQPAIVPPKCGPVEKSGGSEGKESGGGESGGAHESGGKTGGESGDGSGPTPPTSDVSPTGSTSGNPSSSGTASTNPSDDSTPTVPKPPLVRLTALALTPTALLALDSRRSKVSSIAFAFTLSTATHVRVTLAELVRVRGHSRWKAVPGALTFSAAGGRNRRHLSSSAALAPGRYRLTLAPSGGVTCKIAFQVG
jgi:Subtilase family